MAAAAKLCYSPAGIDTVMDGLTPEKTRSFLTMLGDLGHESPIEHASFTFGLEGVSRAFLAQITRHRIASYSVQSQRYVKESHFDYVLPPQIEAVPEAKEEFLRAMENAQASYERIAAILTEQRKAENQARGMEEKAAARAAEKTAIEDARFVLPNACDTKMMVTMNARALHNFFRHRCCSRAQWEIRDCARQMLAAKSRRAVRRKPFAAADFSRCLILSSIRFTDPCGRCAMPDCCTARSAERASCGAGR